jgi:predicted DNA-binding transcriptional regulator YafY
MPKSAVHSAIARQWELLKNLPTRGAGITAADLRQRLDDAGYSVTKRSVERDLIGLSALFGIRCNDGSKPYGWYWMREHALELQAVDFADALSLVLVEDQLGKLLPASLFRVLKPKFEQARLKLRSGTGNRYEGWKDQVRYLPPSLPFLPPKVEARVVETVQEAIVRRRQLHVRYCGLNDSKAQDQTLHPLAFVQQGPVSYLVATAFGYADPRLYALHRMVSIKMTGETSRALKGFSLDAFIEKGAMQFGDGALIHLKARVSTQLACYLTETPLTGDQRLLTNGDDTHTLTATIKDSWHLGFWILSQGAEITVIQPKALRERIRGNLQNALGGYRQPKSTCSQQRQIAAIL